MFEIECPACGKKNTVSQTEHEVLCKRCKADFTALIRIRNVATQMWVQVINRLVEGDLKQAKSILGDINRLTPLSDDEPLVWLLKLVDADAVTDGASTID